MPLSTVRELSREEIIEFSESIANRVHQAYHTDLPDLDRSWRECPKSVCASTRKFVVDL